MDKSEYISLQMSGEKVVVLCATVLNVVRQLDCSTSSDAVKERVSYLEEEFSELYDELEKSGAIKIREMTIALRADAVALLLKILEVYAGACIRKLYLIPGKVDIEMAYALNIFLELEEELQKIV